MRVAVIGAGAVGLGLGSCLLCAGLDVVFGVRRPEAARALEQQGILRTGVFGTFRAAPGSFSVTASLRELADERPGAVLVCTKSTETDAVATAMADAWQGGEAPRVVLCQNGWGNAERFATHWPRERIFNARVITGFRRRGESTVEVTVHAEPIRIGSLFGQDPSVLAPLAAAIDRGGIPCELSRSIERDLLAKLLYNCALNPLAALRGVPYGGVVEPRESAAVLEAVVRETFEVLHASGHRTHWPSAEEYLAFFYAELLPPTREHESSMLQDLRAGRRTEIDALCGAVVRLGLGCRVATPVNQALTTLIHAIEPASSGRPLTADAGSA